MCGICGVYNVRSGEPVSYALLKSMADTMIHRGPDAEGFYASGPIGLGHRRLSIIDLEGGHQPMTNEDQSVWVAFNGEVYNFLELRDGLTQKGYRFKTRSDTEVILHLYREHGVQCFELLRGMFAIAIWDARGRKLVLARDRIGKKPLYFGYDGARVVFASELKALLKVPGISRELDLQAVSDYFSLLYIPAPKSIYSEIRKVRPAHYVVVNEAGLQEQRYWNIQFGQEEELSEEEWAAHLLDLYQEAIGLRLISDVPLGAFLSGGIDSSSVVAIMSELTRDPVKTCSVGFDEKDFDELRYARMVADRFRTAHHEMIVNADAAKILPKLVHHYDEPFADSSAVPTYYVSKAAREHVTVALSGDGGDESFAGYRRYVFDKKENELRSLLPAGVRRYVFGTLAGLYPKADWAPRLLRGKATLQNLAVSHIEGYFLSVSACRPEVKARLLSKDLLSMLKGYDTLDLFRDFYAAAEGNDPLSRIQYVDMMTYLPDDILVKVDRASMANSLEVRAPLLDHKLMELVARMPARLKLRGREGKHILKVALQSRLPREILGRKKMGFGVPLASWLRSDLREMAQDLLFQKGDDGFLSRAAIERLWKEHQAGWRDRGPELWTVLMFRLWQDGQDRART